MISWQEQHPWKTDTSPNTLWGLTTLPRIFTRHLLIPDFCLRQLFQKPLVFVEPWLYPQWREEMARLPAEPIRLAGQQQSPGAPAAQLPRRAPWRGHRGVSLLPFAHISSTQSHPLTWPSGLCAIQPCLSPTTSASSLMFMKGCC